MEVCRYEAAVWQMLVVGFVFRRLPISTGKVWILNNVICNLKRALFSSMENLSRDSFLVVVLICRGNGYILGDEVIFMWHKQHHEMSEL